MENKTRVLRHWGWDNPKRWRCPKCKSTLLRRDGSTGGRPKFMCRRCGSWTIKPIGMKRQTEKTA